MPPTNELLNNRRCRPAMDESAPIVRSPLERDHASPHVAPPIPSQHFPRCCRVADKLPPRTSVIGVYRDLATASASKRLSGREGIFQQFCQQGTCIDLREIGGCYNGQVKVRIPSNESSESEPGSPMLVIRYPAPVANLPAKNRNPSKFRSPAYLALGLAPGWTV